MPWNEKIINQAPQKASLCTHKTFDYSKSFTKEVLFSSCYTIFFTQACARAQRGGRLSTHWVHLPPLWYLHHRMHEKHLHPETARHNIPERWTFIEYNIVRWGSRWTRWLKPCVNFFWIKASISQNSPTLLQQPKNSFNSIASGWVTQVEKLFVICGSVSLP